MTLLALRTALGRHIGVHQTHTDMARRLEISYSHYQKLERGERNPSKYLQRLIDEIAATVAEGE